MARKKDSSRQIDPELKKKLEKLERDFDDRTQITRIKRIQGLLDKLEGTDKIRRLEKTKKKAIIIQFIGIMVLFPFLMYFNGASVDPFYLPIYHSLLMLFGWLLLILISLFIFRFLRIKRHKSYSIKYLVARNSMRKAMSFAVVALIILGFLYTPYITEVVNDASSVENQSVQLTDGDDNVNFTATIELPSRCVLDLRGLKSLTVSSARDDINSEIDITLYEKYGNKNESMISETIDSENLNVTFGEDTLDPGEFKVWILHMSSEYGNPLEYSFRMEVFPDRQTSFSLLSFVYMGVFIQFTAVFYPFKKRYTGEGIYR